MIISPVLITRPTHQSHHLTHLIHEAGGRVSQLPLFTIEPVAFKPIKLDDFDTLIFLSANAVHCFFAINEATTTTKTIIAIGPATQQALAKLGFHAIIPDIFSSEGILEIPILQHISQQSIAIISGENTKPILAPALIARGARVTPVICYARCAMMHHMEVAFPVLQKNKIATVICTSNESLSQLMRLFEDPKHRAWLLKRALCVISDEMKANALSLGFQTVIQADNATDDAIIKALSS
jgi:uroporphyrinogen-III synthase